MIRLLVIAAMAFWVLGCEQVSTPAPESVQETTTTTPTTPTTEEDKTFYALGLAVAQSMSQFDLTEDELALVITGMKDALSGQEPLVDVNLYQPKIGQLGQSRLAAAAAKTKAAAAGYLTDLAAQPGAQSFDSGLVMFELVAGDGPQPAATDTVKVHYHGTLPDGAVFDSSVDRGTPATFPLNGVIPCWTEAVQKIKVGGKSRVVCPSDIAYGDRGRPPKIQPGATLIFEVELLGIE